MLTFHRETNVFTLTALTPTCLWAVIFFHFITIGLIVYSYLLISPRRFGKSSVVAKALNQSGRKSITINLQQVTSVADLSAKLLREFFKVHPMERIRHLISHFRIIPTLSTNPITGTMDVSFQPGVDASILLEDVMALIEKAHSREDRIIIVLDEFQEILDLDPRLDKKLRAMMQKQEHINYILLGSQESMMTDIFERKKSPFYHFGEMMRLGKLPREDFHRYLSERQCRHLHPPTKWA